MSSKKKKNIIIYLSKVMLIALLIVLLVRSFFMESYTISSSQMENTLLRGDEVFVDKTAYGIRLPITILSIPFTFDNILGSKSYSSSVQLSYKRLFENKIKKDDVVLFNNPLDLGKPLDKRLLIVNRCSALPGDTITIDNAELYYSFVIPYRGFEIELTENNLRIYQQLILSEQQERASIEYTKLLIDEVEQTTYTFIDDYYWMLSDNKNNPLDSQSLGFISMRNIIGKVRCVWYSSHNGNVRWDRCFSSIK